MGCRARAILVVAAGILVHLSLGHIFTFGNMAPYMTSYIRKRSYPHTLTHAQSVWVFAVSSGVIGAFVWVGGLLLPRLGPRLVTLLGAWTMSLGVALTYLSVQHSFALCVLTYGVVTGVGCGLAYAIPVACAVKWVPDRTGLVNGLVMAGYGACAFVFDQVQTAFVNPANLPPDQPDALDRYFSQDSLLDRVPYCFLLLGGCYATMQLIGCLLLSFPPETEESAGVAKYEPLPETEEPITPEVPMTSASSIGDESCEGRAEASQKSVQAVDVEKDTKTADVTPRDMLKMRAFYTLYVIFILIDFATVFIFSLYKVYGLTFIPDDHFMAVVGALASICNASGRVLWGLLSDRLPQRLCVMLMCGCFAFLVLTLGLTSWLGRHLYAVWVCLLFLTSSGVFPLMSIATAKYFGLGHFTVNFGLLFTSNVLASPLSPLLTSLLLDVLGWNGMFLLVASLFLISCLLAFTLNVKKPNGEDV